MTFYLAGKYQFRGALCTFAAMLQAAGHTVRAEWLYGGHEGEEPTRAAEWKKADLDDIDACDALVLFNLPIELPPEPSTGRFVEFGYAMAKGKRLIVVGQGGSIFYNGVERYATVDAFLDCYAPCGVGV